MITYRDRTFCSAECKNEQCPVILTKDIMVAAKLENLPISIADYSLGCEAYIEKPLEEYYVK